MRKIRIIEQISLDGVIQQSADENDFPYGNWTAPYRTPAGRELILAAYGESFGLLLGRRTYDMWSGFWPKAPSSPMADRLNAATKYIATHRPEGFAWGPAESLGPDIVEGIRRIKAQDGPEVILAGSSTLTSTLIEHRLDDEEKREYFTHLTREADLQVFGRKTYQLMVPYWPEVLKNPSETKADHEFARAFDSTNKIVFSRSLNSTEDKKTRIVGTNLRDEILKFKQEQGKNILLVGVDIPSQLIHLALIHQYPFLFAPSLAGEGRRLLEGVSLPERLHLKLVDSKFFKSGCVALHYSKQ